MHLAFVIARYFPYGGAQRDFLALVEEMSRRGHRISVITSSWEGHMPSDWQLHLCNLKSKTNHGKNIELSEAVISLKQSEQFDCVVGFTRLLGLDVYFAADESFLAHRYHGLKKLLPRYRAYAKLESSLFQSKELKVLYLTEQQRNSYHGVHPEAQSSVVMPVSIDKRYCYDEAAYQTARAWRKNNGQNQDKITLLFVAKDFNTKGLDRVITALKQLDKAEQKQFVLWVLGDGKKEKYNGSLSGLAVDVTFFGGQADTEKYYLAADYLVHPARKEAAGMVIAEALAAKLPVLVSSVCGYAFLAKDDPNSTILKSEEIIDDLVDSLQKISSIGLPQRGEGSSQIVFQSRAVFCADQIESWYDNAEK